MNSKNKIKSFCRNATNYQNENFVGMKFIDNDVQIYFPIGYDIPDDDNECIISIINLLKTISISNVLTDSNKEYTNDSGTNEELPINSFLWIINDYLKNGLYKDKEKEYKNGYGGKINWKKTLNTKFNICKKSIIYLNPIIEKNTIEDSIVTEIHSYCIEIAINYIGWLFGNIRIPKSNLQESNNGYYISLINKEIMSTFDDRKKTLLINLKKVLEKMGGVCKSKIKDYGINNYEYVWEYLVNTVFGNDLVEKYFPSSSWHILDWDEYKNSSLRPDTILKTEDNVYIIDSKYYKFGITFNPLHLPQTDSIQKQITYGEYIKSNGNFNFDNIYNAFIIPYNKNNNKKELNKNIEYVGFSKSNWKEEKSSNSYEHISLILIDTKYLIDCYFGESLADTKMLINSIEEIVNTF